MKDYAKYFFGLGLNITCITNTKTFSNSNTERYKRPYHSYEQLFDSRQSLEQLNAFEWDNVIGIGTLCGQKFSDDKKKYTLIVFDFDGISLSELEKALTLLGTSKDYEWVVRSGSHLGFHVYFFVHDYSLLLQAAKLTGQNALSYSMTQLGEPIVTFERLDILIRTHVVLPPSLHASTFNYEFINCAYPNKLPQILNENSAYGFLSECCDNDTIQVLSDVYFPAPFRPVLNTNALYQQIEYIVIDIETDGLIESKSVPNILQIAWYCLNKSKVIIKKECYAIQNMNLHVNNAFHINHLDPKKLNAVGYGLDEVLNQLRLVMNYCNVGVCYNKDFDLSIINSYLLKKGYTPFNTASSFCAMIEFAKRMNIKNYVTLEKAYETLFSNRLTSISSHNAGSDVYKTYRLFKSLF